VPDRSQKAKPKNEIKIRARPASLHSATPFQLHRNFKLFIGNGSRNPADGFSFNFAPICRKARPAKRAPELESLWCSTSIQRRRRSAIGIKVPGTEFAMNRAKATLSITSLST
jgi:hypothetical protein